MPTLAWLTFKAGSVPTLPTAEAIILSCPLAYRGIEARIYQAYTGWLRESHDGMVLARYGNAFKNPKDPSTSAAEKGYLDKATALRDSLAKQIPTYKALFDPAK